MQVWIGRGGTRGQNALQGRPNAWWCFLQSNPPHPSIHPKVFIEHLLGTQRWMRGVSCPQKAVSLVGQSGESADNYRKPHARLYNG